MAVNANIFAIVLILASVAFMVVATPLKDVFFDDQNIKAEMEIIGLDSYTTENVINKHIVSKLAYKYAGGEYELVGASSWFLTQNHIKSIQSELVKVSNDDKIEFIGNVIYKDGTTLIKTDHVVHDFRGNITNGIGKFTSSDGSSSFNGDGFEFNQDLQNFKANKIKIKISNDKANFESPSFN